MRESRPKKIFLERRSYRRRRMIDALRMLPVLGAWLFLLPVLWPSADTAPATSRVLAYVFLSWAGLIVLSWLLTWTHLRLGNMPGQDDDDT